MPLEILSDDLHAEIQKKKKEKDNTIGCHIKVDEGLVKVMIPQSGEDNPDLILTFSKREIKELLQDIYVS